jgi:DNA-binding CsgD family transcriptional regulator/tetratricopeptide (TPR) repeat protein
VLFGGLLELVRPLADRLADLPRGHRYALEAALGVEEGGAGDRFAVGAGTLSLLAAAAEHRPVLVLADDLHWVDRPSREALSFAARRLDADAVAVVVALRAAEGIPDRDLTRFEQVPLCGLDVEATAAIVGADQARAAHTATGGNPLALLHLKTAGYEDDPLHLPAAVPDRLIGEYRLQMDALPWSTRAALVVVAADDSGQAALVAAALVGAGLATADLVAAESAGLVETGGGRVRFTHPLARSVAYHAASRAERRSAHASLADACGVLAEPERRAWHLAASAPEPEEQVAEALEQVGERASRRAAHATAVRAFSLSAGLTPPDGPVARRLLSAARAANRAGRSREAEALAREARDRARGTHQLAEATMAWAGFAEYADLALDGRVEALLVETAAIVQSDDVAQAARLIARASNFALFGRGNVEESERLAREAFAIAETAGVRDSEIMFQQGWHDVRLGSLDRGLGLIDESINHALRDNGFDLATRLHIFWHAFWARDRRPALAMIERAEQTARQEVQVGMLPDILAGLAMIFERFGRWSEADTALREATELAREIDQPLEEAFAHSTLGLLAANRGDAQQLEESTQAVAPYVTHVWVRHATSIATRVLALSRGDLESAAHVQPFEFTGPDVWDGWDTDTIEALIRLGRTEQAAAAIEEPRPRMPYSRARLDRARGLAAPDGFFAEPLQHSIEAFASLSAPFEQARSELCLGERLRRSGQRVTARRHLRSALETFEQLSAEVWAENARRELAASGERLRRDHTSRDELTPQERQIAQLVAQGRTNKETAAAVFLSPKTIETHLSCIYRKLGIHSRAELAAKLEQHAPVSSDDGPPARE